MTTPIYGPTKGALLAKAAIVPKKSPNSTMMPYSSMQKPIRGHRSSMRASPAKKAAVPFAFCFLAKKSSVFCGPIIMVSPMRKRICSPAWCEVRYIGSRTGHRGTGSQGGSAYISHRKPGEVPKGQLGEQPTKEGGLIALRQLTWPGQRRALLLLSGRSHLSCSQCTALESRTISSGSGIIPPEQKATPISVAESTSRLVFHRPLPSPPARSRACVRACDASRGNQAALGKLYGSVLWESDSHMEGILERIRGRTNALVRRGWGGCLVSRKKEVGRSWPNSTATDAYSSSCRKTGGIVEKCLVATETGVPALAFAGQISESYPPNPGKPRQGKASPVLPPRGPVAQQADPPIALPGAEANKQERP